MKKEYELLKHKNEKARSFLLFWGGIFMASGIAVVSSEKQQMIEVSGNFFVISLYLTLMYLIIYLYRNNQVESFLDEPKKKNLVREEKIIEFCILTIKKASLLLAFAIYLMIESFNLPIPKVAKIIMSLALSIVISGFIQGVSLYQKRHNQKH